MVKKKKKNPISEDGKCFQHAITVALSHKSIVKDLQRISKIKLFISKYNWKIDFLSHKNDWKKFETSNKTIALNILYVSYISQQIRHASILKQNSKRENQVILLMITDNEKWHYLAVKKLPALIRKKHQSTMETFIV